IRLAVARVARVLLRALSERRTAVAALRRRNAHRRHIRGRVRGDFGVRGHRCGLDRLADSRLRDPRNVGDLPALSDICDPSAVRAGCDAQLPLSLAVRVSGRSGNERARIELRAIAAQLEVSGIDRTERAEAFLVRDALKCLVRFGGPAVDRHVYGATLRMLGAL